MSELVKKYTEIDVVKNDTLTVLKVGDVIYRRSDSYYEELYTVIDIVENTTDNGHNYIRIITDKVTSVDGNGKPSYETMSLNEVSLYYSIYKGDKNEAMDLANKVFNGELSLTELLPKDESTSKDLMVMNKSFYDNALMTAQEAKSKAMIVQKIVNNKILQMKNNLRDEIEVFNKVVEKLQKIIFTLELYAGVGEDIIQINQGQFADNNEKIHIMQSMLYMDEEVGDPENGGVSYDSVDKFYDWVRKFNNHLGYPNYNLLIPYQKGVRIMRVRREASSRYISDSFGNRYYDEIAKEMQTCVLIRNGENMYVIHSKMDFNTKLFPTKEEFENVVQEVDGDMELLLDKLTNYRYGMILIQGILDRTPYLAEPNTVSVLKPNDSIIFEYEKLELNDGTKTFGAFLSTQNIEVGTRILALGLDSGRYSDRFYNFYQNDYSYPSPPDDGIYELIRHHDKDNKTHLNISYIPDDTIYNSATGHYTNRKKPLRFKIKRHDNIVDFDLVSHRDIEWLESMLYDRRDRKRYLSVVSMLENLKKYKAEEYEMERPFVLLICQELKITEIKARDYVYWWKTKNKYKRPISKDDLKALRMIVKKYNKDIKDGIDFQLQPNIETTNE